MQELLQATASRRLICPDSVDALITTARLTEKLAGVVAEVGVYKGGSARVLAKTLPGKSVYLFDTFSGMPESSTCIENGDKHAPGDFGDTSLDEVREFLADCPNVVFVPGEFPDSIEEQDDPEQQFLEGWDAQTYSFVHLDTNSYLTTVAALHYFWPRLEENGYIVLDDYEWPPCEGVTRAIYQFKDHLDPDTFLFEVLRHTGKGTDQCYFMKVSVA